MDWLRQAALTRPEAAALVTRAGTLTYAEMDHAADAVAAIVASSGLADGAVAFWGERDPATVAAVWGIPRAGATAVAIDPSLPPAESMHLTREAGARLEIVNLPTLGLDLDLPEDLELVRKFELMKIP